MALVDAKVIQKYLTINSDLIQEKAFAKMVEEGLQPFADNFVLLNGIIPTGSRGEVTGFCSNLTPIGESIVNLKQQKIVSPNPVPSDIIATELFSVLDSKNQIQRSAAYEINHYILIPLDVVANPYENIALYNKIQLLDKQINDAKALGFGVPPSLVADKEKAQEEIKKEGAIVTKYFKIDIRQFHDTVTAESLSSGETQMFIDKIQIKNKSKDAYTATSNYQVQLDFFFKDFNSLLSSNIEAVPVKPLKPELLKKAGDLETQKIPFLKILYKFLDLNKGKSPLAVQNAPDSSSGLILSKEIVFDQNAIIFAEQDIRQKGISPDPQLYEKLKNNVLTAISTEELDADQKKAELQKSEILRSLGFTFPYTTNFYRKAKPIKDSTGKIIDVQRFNLTKNYHLTYHKHNIDTFKPNASALANTLTSKITLEFVAFEADTSQNKQLGVVSGFPNVTINLYDLLNSRLSSQLFETSAIFDSTTIDASGGSKTKKGFRNLTEALKELESINKELEAINKVLEINDYYQRAKKALADDQVKLNQLKAAFTGAGTFGNNLKIPSLGVSINLEDEAYSQQSISGLRDKLTNTLSEIAKYKTLINKALIFYILETLPRFSIKIPYSALNTFDELNFAKGFAQNFSFTGLGESTLGASQVGTLVPIPGGAAAGAVVGAVGYTAVSVFKALNAEDIKTADFNVTNSRKEFKNSIVNNLIIEPNFAKGIKKLAFNIENGYIGAIQTIGNQSETLFKEENSLGVETASTQVGYGFLKEADPKAVAEGLAAFKSVEVRERTDESVTSTIDLQFVFFGDVVSLINRLVTDGRVKIIMGGKTIFNGDSYSYLNYYYYPISVNLLTNFFNEQILNRSDLYYSCEEFVKDAFEKLVKAPINGVSQKDKTLAGFVPSGFKNVTMNFSFDPTDPEDLFTKTFLKDSAGNLKENFPRIVNLFGKKDNKHVSYDNFLANFAFMKSTKNLDSPKNLAKVFCFTSDLDITGVNFYDQFDEKVKTLKESGITENVGNKGEYHTKFFADFIVAKYKLPVIMTQFPTITDFTILSKDTNVSFTRVDNSNLTTGNLLSANSLIRYPYNFSTNLVGYCSFFIDIGSLVFVTPPAIAKPDGTESSTSAVSQINFNVPNTFGYGGLYVIKSSNYVFTPIRVENNSVKAAMNADRYAYNVEAYNISYGDSKIAQVNSASKTEAQTPIDFITDLTRKK